MESWWIFHLSVWVLSCDCGYPETTSYFDSSMFIDQEHTLGGLAFSHVRTPQFSSVWYEAGVSESRSTTNFRIWIPWRARGGLFRPRIYYCSIQHRLSLGLEQHQTAEPNFPFASGSLRCTGMKYIGVLMHRMWMYRGSYIMTKRMQSCQWINTRDSRNKILTAIRIELTISFY